MSENKDITNLEQLLDRICAAGGVEDNDQVSIGAVLKKVGWRSFGPLLLFAGVLTLAPLVGDIPGVPTFIGIIVFLIAIQLLLHQEHFWLPNFLLKRSVSQNKLQKATAWFRKPAKLIDKFLKPRLQVFIEGKTIYVVALICLIIAVAMPVMELVPFSANGAGAALTAFGLSLIARDGLLAIIALVFTASTAGLVIYVLM